MAGSSRSRVAKRWHTLSADSSGQPALSSLFPSTTDPTRSFDRQGRRMKLAFLRRSFQHVAGIFNYAHSILVISGMLCGSSLLVGLHQFQANFGTTLVATTGLVLALVLGLLLGRLLPRQMSEDVTASGERISGDLISWFAMSHLGLAAATLAVPWLVPTTWSLVRQISSGTVGPVGLQLVLFFVAAVLAVSFQTIVMTRIPWHWICDVSVDRGDARERLRNGAKQSERSADWTERLTWVSAKYLLGVSVGILVSATCLAPYWNVRILGLLTALLECMVFVAELGRCYRTASRSRSSEFTDTGPIPSGDLEGPAKFPATTLNPARLVCQPQPKELGGLDEKFAHGARALIVGSSEHASRRGKMSLTPTGERLRISKSNARTMLTFLSLGVLLAGLSRMLHQLMPVGSSTIATEWAIGLCGVACGIRLAGGRSRMQKGDSPRLLPVPMVATLGTALWVIALIAAFPLLTNLSLWLNANIAHVAGMVASRIAIIGIVLFPVALGWGVLATDNLATSRGDRESRPNGVHARLSPCAIVIGTPHNIGGAAGFLLARWFLLEQFGVSASLMGGVWVLILLMFADARQFFRKNERMGRVAVWATAISVGFVLVSPCWMSRYDPVRSARLLFDTNVFWAKRSGLASELLPYVDASRCVSVREGERSTFSVWRCDGVRLQIRESGVPKSYTSPEPDICLHYAPEVLQVVVPLTLHETPFRVLLLGLGAGTQLETCLAFPTQSVVCIEADRQLVPLLKSSGTGSHLTEALNDERLQLVIAEPALAIVCGESDFDVVIGTPDLPALLQSVSRTTEEYYRHVAERMAPRGIFCQRFQNADCGAEPLRILAKTFQAAFREVVVLETAPGEMLFIATNASDGLNRPGLLDRIKAPHVCSLLGNLGIDWLELLNLSLVSHSELSQIVHADRTDTNTAANGRLAFQLPLEVMRWGAKRQETVALLFPHSTRLVSFIDKDAHGPELQQRQRAVASRNNLMTDYPDRYWVYRKTVKKQLTQHPRSKIRLLSGEMPQRDLHAEDQRRLAYFVALDRAAKDPTRETIQAMAAFRTPYDPLISHFLDQEVAALWTRCPERDVRQELIYRLRAIYGSSPAERSIRDVIAALTLLREYPEAVPDPAERWDRTNALLQTLVLRWSNRASVSPTSSQVVLNDIDKSVVEMETTFAFLHDLANAAGVTSEEWQGRQQWLEKTLLRPLRTYRSEILPHHYKNRQVNSAGPAS